MLIELINDFKEKEIEFVSLENNIDTSNPIGMLLFSICAAFSEMERTLITERVKTGLYAAHKKGRKGGRPKSITKDKLKTLKSLMKNNDLSVSKKCKMTGISRSVYYRTINSSIIQS
jgi:DNA invertase Pin-like site-specific DNA recombinase